MKTLFRLQRLRDISIKKKLYFVVGTMAVLIAIELLTLWFAIHTLSSVRAFVGAEGLWSKAQKDAIYYLGRYYRTFDEADYKAFQQFMSVPLGDHKTRLELLKANPDMNIARQGFLEGRVHPDDIDQMIKLVRRFHDVNYLHKAIGIWAQGDSVIAELIPIGEKFHEEVNSPSPSQQRLKELYEQIGRVNQSLTALEDNFSFTLGEGSRWLENTILKLVFSVALTVEAIGLLLSISVTRGMARGLNEINRAADKISKGDLSDRAEVFSRDEIGQVAAAVNQMTEQLTFSNKELEQFAYIASHDLQEPLRTISNYTGLIRERYKGKLDDNADKYLDSVYRATRRMQQLIRDVLDYSTLGHGRKIAHIDCNKILTDVTSDMELLIRETGSEIISGKLPVINGYEELRSVFQNLISNAIKFRKNDVPMVIQVNAVTINHEWIFSLKDNGIGIDKTYFERNLPFFRNCIRGANIPEPVLASLTAKKSLNCMAEKYGWNQSPEPGVLFILPFPK